MIKTNNLPLKVELVNEIKMKELRLYMLNFAFIFSLMSLISLTSLVSCTLKVENKGVSHQVWIPWPNQEGQYQIQKVSVDTITNWSPLRGSAVQIRGNFNQLDSEHASSKEVTFDYTTDASGAVIPMTPFAVEVASIYANFERLQKLDQELGIINADESRNVYVKLKLKLESGDILTNNAFYNFLTNSFYVVPYENSGLPLSVNGAVLAHEHFHSVFGRVLQRPLYEYGLSKNINLFKDYTVTENPPSQEGFSMKLAAAHNPAFFKKEFMGLEPIEPNNESFVNLTVPKEFRDKLIKDPSLFMNYHLNKIYLMALNEGLADVWAWLYSSNPCFISSSLAKSSSFHLPADLWDWLASNVRFNYYCEMDIVSGSQNTDGDDHDNRCLSSPSHALSKKPITLVANNEKMKVFHKKMSESYCYNELFDIERKVVDVMGYRLGTNLARLFYKRLSDRGELYDEGAHHRWAKHIVTVLPLLLTKMKDVYIDGMKIKSLYPWDEALDLLLFSEGAPSVPKEQCADWVKVLNGSSLGENFRKMCGV